MGFLDNLENNLKALERQEERDPEALQQARERCEAERASALARAPHVDALKTSPFTSELLGQCRVIGRRQRVLVQFAWIGDNLRLDAGEKRLELAPTEKGIVGVYSVQGAEQAREPVDPANDNAEALVRRWLEA